MKALTEKQRNILDFIEDFQNRESMAPTVYEIADHFGIKTSTVFAHIRAMQRKNYLTRSSKARSIALIKGRKPGRADTPGSLVLEVLNPQPTLPKELVISTAAFGKDVHLENLAAAIVEGECMRELGIYESDMVVAERNAEIRPGDLVVVEWNGKFLVRSCFPIRGNTVELRPAAPEYKSEKVNTKEVKIHGRVAALFRLY